MKNSTGKVSDWIMGDPALADLEGLLWDVPPLQTKMFLISCSFLVNSAKSYVSAPHEGRRPLLQRILFLVDFDKSFRFCQIYFD